MTIGITCNLSDGVIIGADSAITILGAPTSTKGVTKQEILKVYNDAEKVFQLGKLPIGILSYGQAIIEKRTIESYVREFELRYQDEIKKLDLFTISGYMRDFFYNIYMKNFKPELEKLKGIPFDKIPDNEKPNLGIVIAGFSPNQPLSEAYDVNIPLHKKKSQIIKLRDQGNFGSNWFGVIDPIRRFIKGFDVKLLNMIIGYFVEKKNVKFTQSIEQDLNGMLSRFEYKIPYVAMPLQEGINHVKFLLDIVINHNKFVVGAPVCSGPLRIAVITKEGYKKITENELRLI